MKNDKKDLARRKKFLRLAIKILDELPKQFVSPAMIMLDLDKKEVSQVQDTYRLLCIKCFTARNELEAELDML